MSTPRKVYDFNLGKVKQRLVVALKRRDHESTVADLIAETGLPKFQVEQAIAVVSEEYRGQLRVTESGELLYHFPHGMRNQDRGFLPRLSRFFRKAKKSTARALKTLFKVWIMVMVVGYFVLFVVLLVLAVVASFAASFAGQGRGRSRGGGILGFYLVMRVFQMFIWIWLFSGAGSYRDVNRSMSSWDKKQRRKKGKALYKSIFAYSFGDEDPNKDFDEKQKRQIISFIRGRKGVITLEELMVQTGKDQESAQELMNRLVVEFEGEPSVTEQGTLIYLFPELLKSRQVRLRAGDVSLMSSEKKKTVPFNNNPKRVNRWITFFSAFNVAFGTYFLSYAAANPAAMYIVKVGQKPKLQVNFAYLYQYVKRLLERVNLEAAPIIYIGLGLVPLVFSFFFFLVPYWRNRRNKKKNEQIKKENFRRRIYFDVVSNADSVNPEDIKPASQEESPKDALAFKQKVLRELAAAKSAKLKDRGDGTLTYQFPEIDRELKDVEEYRKKIDMSRYDLGDTVFDTDE
jgi:hypothetical protein